MRLKEGTEAGSFYTFYTEKQLFVKIWQWVLVLG